MTKCTVLFLFFDTVLSSQGTTIPLLFIVVVQYLHKKSVENEEQTVIEQYTKAVYPGIIERPNVRRQQKMSILLEVAFVLLLSRKRT